MQILSGETHLTQMRLFQALYDLPGVDTVNSNYDVDVLRYHAATRYKLYLLEQGWPPRF